MRLQTLALAALALMAGACSAPTPNQPRNQNQPTVDRSGFDTSVRVQDDLFRAVNGQWLKDTPIPADKSNTGSFVDLGDRADARVRQIVEELAAKKDATGTEQKIGAYYRSFMDEAAIDQAGLAPLAPWLKEIDAIKTRADLAALLGRWQGRVGTPLAVAVYPDSKEPGIYRAILWQDGLGLPDRDYYLVDGNERFEKARAAYLVYLETLFKLGQDNAAAAHARQVYALEKRLAQAQWSRVENRDPVKTYNPFQLNAWRNAAPGLDWAQFIRQAALPAGERFSVAQPSYAKALARAAAEVPLADWKLYLRVRLLDGSASVLPKAYRDANFAFKGRALQGKEQPLPRWQQATASIDGALGEAVGQVYVARHFPPAYKARMSELVKNLLTTYGNSIDALAWMGPQTKQRAKQKLALYTTKIGYPETWRDYSALAIREADPVGNDMRAGRFNYEFRALRAGKPVDRREWEMTPQTVNAYYNALANEIVFPAAILEPPFFDMAADDAANYGAIGAIIGHEISHGFDDEGSQYDGTGKLDNWWTAADRKAFEAIATQLVAQFNAYEPLPGKKVNGQLTLGENIADLSGLQIAYKAYHLALAGKPAPVIDGLSGDQRFFISWARAWRIKSRPEREAMLLTVDTHSPPEFRTNGAAVNHDGFHASFGTKPGDRMFKPAESRIRIW